VLLLSSARDLRDLRASCLLVPYNTSGLYGCLIDKRHQPRFAAGAAGTIIVSAHNHLVEEQSSSADSALRMLFSQPRDEKDPSTRPMSVDLVACGTYLEDCCRRGSHVVRDTVDTTFPHVLNPLPHSHLMTDAHMPLITTTQSLTTLLMAYSCSVLNEVRATVHTKRPSHFFIRCCLTAPTASSTHPLPTPSLPMMVVMMYTLLLQRLNNNHSVV
jgi:hypothetical protein